MVPSFLRSGQSKAIVDDIEWFFNYAVVELIANGEILTQKTEKSHEKIFELTAVNCLLNLLSVFFMKNCLLN